MRTLTAILLSIFVVLSGCATSSYSTGRDFDSSSVNQIIKGETTKADLLQMLGQPFSKTVISENEEKWIYMYSSGTAKAQSYFFTMKVESTGQQKMLDILLRDGIVTNYTYNEGPMPGSLNVR
jgi:outer membrane protein assembly factor BamE (lipoprotein component of BamABCDE complex)